MPWLRDFMTAAEPPISSFGKLADVCLDHADWPDQCRPKHRSLSTLFSKLDRKQDLDWLRDRIEVQQVLAVLLGRTVADIRAAIGETPYVADTRFLRLSDIRYARDIDLTLEEPPPGIPREAYDTPSWQYSWWLSSPGSGRSLVGSWLRCRGLAHTAHIRSRDDLDKLPTRGPLYLEVDDLLGADELGLGPRDLEALRASQRPILIAAAFAPPARLKMNLVESAPPLDYLPELVDWVGEHLDGSGHFHPDRAEQWIRRVAVPAGAVQNFGDALGLLGMIDEVHPRSLLAKSLDELGEHFVRRRVREANEAISVAPRLAEDAFPALQECAARVLVAGSNALHSAHAVDEWTALLSSPQNEDVPDPEWFTSALRGALGAQITRRDLRRAARKLQPGAFQLTKSLEAAGILVRTGGALARDEEGALRNLRPRWLVSLLASRAAQEVLRLPATQWGQVLLSGIQPERVVSALIAATERDDFQACFGVVEEFDAEVPELVAALEASLIACGMATLSGTEVPDELVEGLLAHTAETCFVLNHIPTPRLTCDEYLRGFDSAHWYAALLALLRAQAFPLPHLDPLRGGPLTLATAFESEVLPLLQAEPAILSAKQAGQLLQDLSELTSSGPRPPYIELLFDTSTPSEELYFRAARDCPLDFLLAGVGNAGERKFLSTWWELVKEEGDPTEAFINEGNRKLAWGYLPSEVRKYRTTKRLPIAFENLLPHQYAQWLNDEDSNTLPADATPFCPIDAVLTCLEERGLTALAPKTLSAVISLAPARFAFLPAKLIAEEDSATLSALLALAPANASAPFTQELPPHDELLTKSADMVEMVRTALSRAVRHRHPQHVDCYRYLLALEEGLAPLRRLPGA